MNHLTPIPQTFKHLPTRILGIVAGLTFGLLIGAEALNAQSSWSQTNGPNGGPMRAAVMQGGAVIVSGNGGMYRRAGNSWSKSADLLMKELLKTNNAVIGIGNSLDANTLYRTTDQGASWGALSVPEGTRTLVSVVEGSIYMAVDDTLYASHDDGTTFEEIGPLPGLMGRAPIGTKDRLICNAGFFGGDFFVSEDGGLSWEPLEAELPAPTSAGISIQGESNPLYAISRDSIYESNDGGLTWSNVTGNLPSGFRVNVFEANSERTLLALNRGEVYELTDAGWELLEVPGIVSGISLDRGMALLTTSHGLFEVEESSRKAQDLTDGLRTVSVSALAQVDGDLYAGSSTGLYSSPDLGESWFRLDDQAANSLNHYDGALYVQAGNEVRRTTDGGETWMSVQSQFEEYKQENYDFTEFALPFTGFDISGSGTLYLTAANSHSEHGVDAGWTHGGVFRSEDRGETWTEVSGNLPHNGITYVPTTDVLALGDGLVIISTYLGNYFSRSGGGSWTPINAGLPTEDRWQGSGQLFALNGDIFLASARGLFRITEVSAGAVWERLPDMPDDFDFYGITSGNIEVIDGAIWVPVSKYVDGSFEYAVFAFDGAGWERIETGLPEEVRPTTFLRTESFLFAGTQTQSVWMRESVSSVDRSPDRVDSDMQLSIAPNPVVNQARLVLDGASTPVDGIDIVNSKGEIVKSIGSLPPVGELELDLGDVPTGHYYLTVTSGDRVRSARFVKR